MIKKLYTALAALALLGGAGAVTVSALGESSPSVQGVDLDVTPNYVTVTTSVKFDVPNKKVYPHISFTLPTEGRDDNWVYQPLVVLTQVIVQRMESYYDENPVVIYSETDLEPGSTIEVDDTKEGLVMGKEYVYRVFAYVGDKFTTATDYCTAGIQPIYPTEISCKSTDGENPVVIEVTCPQKGYGSSWNPTPFPEGVEFTSLKFFVVNKETNTEELIHEVENPVAGEKYSYTYNDATLGSNQFKFRVDTDFGNSSYGYASAYIGPDFPSAPKDLVAEAIDDYVKISWSPSEPYYGGKYDPSQVEYTVYRNDNDEYENYRTVWKEIGKTYDCEFIDNLSDLIEETSVKYQVTPSNGVEANGNNSSTTYSAIVVGPPCPLPFIETFNTGTKFSKNYDKKWDRSFDYYSMSEYYIRDNRSFTLPDGTEMTVVTGAAGGDPNSDTGCDNYLYVAPYDSPWGTPALEPGYLTSGKFTLADAVNPYVSFCIVPLKGSNGTVTVQIYTGEKDENENPVFEDVQLVKYDDEYEIPAPAESVVKKSEGEEEEFGIAEPWERVYVSLADYVGKEVCKLRLKFEYRELNGRQPMCFDELRIDDYPAATDLTATVGAEGIDLSWSLGEAALAKKPKFNVYLNDGDTPVASVSELKYVYADIEEGESYNFAVETVYPDEIVAPVKAETSVSVPVTQFVVDGITYKVAGDETTPQAVASELSEELTTVTVPASVTYKDTQYSVELASDLFSGNTTIEEVKIEMALEQIGDEMFYGATALKNVTIPSSVVKIGDKGFFGCVSLVEITLPEGLMIIENSAFENCTGLSKMVFGENIVRIGDRAFCNCSKLAEVEFLSSVPPTVGTDAFKGVASPCQGSCPDGTLTEYLSVEGLSPITFKGAGVANIDIDGAVSVEYFTLSGARVVEPADGQPVIVRARFANGEVKVGKLLKKSRN